MIVRAVRVVPQLRAVAQLGLNQSAEHSALLIGFGTRQSGGSFLFHTQHGASKAQRGNSTAENHPVLPVLHKPDVVETSTAGRFKKHPVVKERKKASYEHHDTEATESRRGGIRVLAALRRGWRNGSGNRSIQERATVFALDGFVLNFLCTVGAFFHGLAFGMVVFIDRSGNSFGEG